MTPSHYLDQYWPKFNCIFRNTFRCCPSAINTFDIAICKIVSISFLPPCVQNVFSTFPSWIYQLKVSQPILTINSLISGGKYILSDLEHYWIRKWPSACSATSHYLNQCWLISWFSETDLSEISIKLQTLWNISKCCLPNVDYFITCQNFILQSTPNLAYTCTVYKTPRNEHWSVQTSGVHRALVRSKSHWSVMIRAESSKRALQEFRLCDPFEISYSKSCTE